MNEITELPGEIKQFNNYRIGREEIKKAGIQSPMIRSILGGLITIIPDEVHQSRILERPELSSVAGDLISFQIALNDRLDFALSSRKDINSIIEVSREKEDRARERLNLSTRILDDPAKAHWIRSAVDNLVTETEVIEKYVRENSSNLSFADAIKYRRLVNAIASCTVTGVLLGREHLAERLQTINKDNLNWDTIYRKYEWVFGNTAKNSVEKAVIVMDRVATAGQIDDDWFGRHIDDLLAIPTPALIAIREANGNEEEAKQKLYQQRKIFIDDARTQGLGMLPVKAVTVGFKEMQKANRVVTRSARKHYPLLQRFGLTSKLKLPVRETAYVEGVL